MNDRIYVVVLRGNVMYAGSSFPGALANFKKWIDHARGGDARMNIYRYNNDSSILFVGSRAPGPGAPANLTMDVKRENVSLELTEQEREQLDSIVSKVETHWK